MKKLLSLLFVVGFAFVLSACGREDDRVSFKTTYAGHYETLNYLASQSASIQTYSPIWSMV